MNNIEVAKYLEKNNNLLFPNRKYNEEEVEEALLSVSNTWNETIHKEKLRNPSTLQILSIFPGMIGIDRFYMGDILMGILKYFTMGLVGILWIADIISAKKRCRTYNCKKLMNKITELRSMASTTNPASTSNINIGAILKNDEVDFAAIDAQIMGGGNSNTASDNTVTYTTQTNEEKKAQTIDTVKKVAPMVKDVAKSLKDLGNSFWGNP